MNIKVGHVEAGLRSFDRSMPEEINRILTDHVSDLLFAPTKESKNNLLKEGIDRKKIHVTGNTIVDAVNQNKKIADEKGNILKKIGLTSKDYFLVTAHRAENVDIKERLQGIITGLQRIHAEFSIPIIFPVHPRTKKMIAKFHISMDGIQWVDPLGYLDFLQLEANSKLILTDSGGLQEESCILGVPCVTFRDNTERPETIAVGSNMLAGSDSNNIVKGVHLMINNQKKWKNPFGNGTTGIKIINICEEIAPDYTS
jgi:UDP-N-acetylglucosamine 2-epimerase (non-hydrolysing)